MSTSVSKRMAMLAMVVLAVAATAAEPGPVNGDFEDGELGKVPSGWILAKPSIDAGYKAQLTDENPRTGKRCLVLSRDPKEVTRGVGNLVQSVDASAYRGKRIRLRAAVRAEVSGYRNQAQFWLRVDGKDNRLAFFDDMSDRPIVQKEWRDCEILADVAEDATSIALGLMLVGNGRAWLDSISLEAIGKAGEGNETARPLKGRGLDNLVAFTKLLGYVRYFHPSDGVAATDWDRFAIGGVRVVEDAKDPADLAQALDKLFRPVAPTVRVYPSGKPPGDAVPPGPAKDAPDPAFIVWYHHGVGTGSPGSIYSSKRIKSKSDLAALQPRRKSPDVKLPDPAKPFVSDLGGGVSCSVPLALNVDEKGALPPSTAGSKAPGWSKPDGFIPTGNDRSTRLADVALAWNVFQHFYPYFDVVKADWPAELRTALTKAATDPDERAFHDTLRRLIAGLHDGHGSVHLDGTFSYPPFRWEWIEDRLVVTLVGAKGGDLKPGDAILKINGKPAADALAAQMDLISGATAQWKRYRALTRLAEGGKDSEMELDVRAPAGETRTTRVRRSLGAAEFYELAEPRPAKVDTIRPGVMYVDLSRITDKDFDEALPRLEKAKGIVFDLRGYPQVNTAAITHLIDKPVTCAQWHIPVTLHPDRQNVAFNFSNWPVSPKTPRFQAKVAFLTDGRAISYAETYLGIIEHYKLADIVGSATAGTNGNVNPFSLPGRYRVSWTGMKVLKHDGSTHHGVGIQPTQSVSRTIAGVVAKRDEVLERAIDIVTR